MLVHSKNQTLPSLPLSIRITCPTKLTEAEWTPSSAWADLIQRVELKLEEKILRFKLSISERPQLERTWQEELNRGGMECTILAYIDTTLSALSVQNKRHLHWKALEHIPSMNNEVEFVAPAHNLLKKSGAKNMTRQAHKNRTSSILASPHAARKKRFTKLDLALLMNPQKGSVGPAQGEHKEKSGDQKHPPSYTSRLSGSISQPATRNKLTYDWKGPHPCLPQRQRAEGKHDQAKIDKGLARLAPNPPSNHSYTGTPSREGGNPVPRQRHRVLARQLILERGHPHGTLAKN